MTTATVGEFLQRLTRHMAAELLDGETDRRLVERVLATRDEPALLTIVLRHGTMVYQVCRRVLRQPQDAEDAFQATFLVLAQQLHALRQHGSLAGWLHGVALRVARKARARAMAQQRRETAAARPEAAAPDELTWSEVRLALDEELSRLPERWRLPLVLCYLEGQTQDEAAGQLGWSKSTLRRRLEQARAALGSRLRGRGIAWSAALPAVLAAESLAEAAFSPACADATVAAMAAVVHGKSIALAAPARVVELTEGVQRTMSATKIGMIAGALVVLALVTAVVGHVCAASAAPAEVPPEESAALPVERAPLPELTVARADDPQPLTLKGHTSEVQSVCFSRDGKRLVSGGGVTPRKGNPPVPGEVKVWDVEKGTEILALKRHTDMVTSVSFSPDGKRIATAGADQTVRVWDAQKATKIYTLQGQTRLGGSASFSPDGKRLATLSVGHITVWDADTGKELLTLKTDVRPNGAVSFSHDGKRLASVYPWSAKGKLVPGEIKVWDVEKGKELLTLQGHTGFVHSVTFCPDSKRLASAGTDDAVVRVWDADTGKELLTLQGHTAPVCSVCFSQDGKRIASASWDHTVKVWDAEKGKELITLRGHTDLVRGVCFSHDGKRIASASKDQTVKVWTVDAGK